MTKHAVFSFSLLLIFLFRCCTTAGAQAPDITKILEKPGRFTILLRLLKSTGIVSQLNGELQKSNTGFTLFAPPDKAFSDLRSGSINSLSDLQKVQLIQFHILATYVTMPNFQTLGNPVPTQAGDTSAGAFPLNVISSGNKVQISTGVVNATVGSVVYSDNDLVVYQVDKVLLPLAIFSDYEPDSVPLAESNPPVSAKVDKSAGVVSLPMHGMPVFLGIAVNIAALAL
ncbi:fasciclin-like arabinogalactan protein 11 [Juglans microcarpa x Juglans regia]|uniref:fasciclin-like arabinogalactan protein 11 n=1 Tax=Juglans microcarpa x Juglans regia TaxID=2249226 RepID=UPI001B7F3CC3|nr:fasciclin-like arabinogalactan protein 11 [Juglans microcarpa x Juglans regia]